MNSTVLDRYDSLLFDLDGTVWEGGRLLPHAESLLNSSQIPVMYITNNASRGPEAVAEILKSLGVSATEQQVLTSAQAAIDLALLNLEPGASVYVLGAESFKTLAVQAGFRVVDSADDSPAAVLHGHNPETGWSQLSEAALSIQRGALYFASNLDTTLPMERGLMVGNGSMVAAVVAATGVHPTSAGKPEPAMFQSAARRLSSERPLAVGDRLNTDIAGGVAAGMDTFHVLTGVSKHWSLVYAPVTQRPTYVAKDLSSLSLAPELLMPGIQGDYRVTLDGKDIRIAEGSGNPEAALRSVLSLAWRDGFTFDGKVIADGEKAEKALKLWGA
ncbi:putative sugar phosphatase of HAD superfamily [Corynebacterium mustelae]|uniref:Putative sugar phosphatase of HAD superfamily n=1 Tax=Corynebacterium mustelae TaxID=571915 RepID=A0A0G3GXG6_9CORY|nr:HAD-IIA family hydrolase [Corynebacterium mustelae]AKK05861.1 putative sugar phosphatase of HAD superfamily [Corynebacterium mustelae]